MAWDSTHKRFLQKIHFKQKYEIDLKCDEKRFTHTKSLQQSLQVLNVLQINI